MHLEADFCVGCTNCIKRCPTGAIRVRDGKATIKKEYCIDCGECIRTCKHHAKVPIHDLLVSMEDPRYKYKVALPAPSLYGQFNNLDDSNIVLTALLKMGFDAVYEVGAAAEIVSAMSRKYIADHKDRWPLISTACPAIVKLIRVRFPGLIDHLLPIQPPVEIAATLARREAVRKTGLPPDKIGIFFISPCPAKVSSCKSPLGVADTDIDVVLAMKDVYMKILPFMEEAAVSPEDLATAGRIGVGWGRTSGEAAGLINDDYLAADGIWNCISVLEDLEDQKISGIRFIELNACSGGCVGGVLTVENPFIASVKLNRLRKYLPVAKTHLELPDFGMWTEEIEYEPVFALGGNMKERIRMMTEIEQLVVNFPGLDCGSCGAPSCHALAEDIVRGQAKEEDCIYYLLRTIRGNADPEGK